MDDASDLPGCVVCGSCCFSESERHARVTGDDYERLGDDAETFVTFLANEAFMKLSEDTGGAPRHCAALIVTPEEGAFLCQVYERRPQVCRDLERASGACAGERHAKAGRPKRALAIVREATRRS